MNGPAPGRLVIRPPNWLGDAVLAIPAMAALRTAFANAHVTVAAPAAVAELLRQETPVRPDEVIDLPSRQRDVAHALRQVQADACVLFPNSFRSAWQCRRAGIRERWGFATSGRGWLMTRRSPKPVRSSSRHHSDYYASLVRGLLDSPRIDEKPSLRPAANAIDEATALLRRRHWPADEPFVALVPGAAYGEAKQWAPDRMAELAARLHAERGMRCVVLGAAHDRPAARAIESWLRAKAPAAAGNVLDLVGATTLGVLVALLDRTAVCVSNDSGGMHVASALGRPVVALFGPTDERSTRPLGDHELIIESVFCRPCMLRDCPIDHRCMKRITVDRVFAVVSARLTAQGAG